VILYSASRLTWLRAPEGLIVESQEYEALDLGSAVVVWQITDSGSGHFFDLMVLEDAAEGLKCQALEYPEEGVTLDADSLPAGAHLVICFPKELVNAEQRTTESNSGTADTS
jgi:hypothetical protein